MSFTLGLVQSSEALRHAFPTLRQGFPSASIPAAGPLRQAGPMAWRVADAADAFDSLSMPVPSRVYGPAKRASIQPILALGLIQEVR